jgi:Family of unknown function (DUF6151)
MNHPLQCKCGNIKAVISNPDSANRAVCYCKDCQDFARFLGQERETLDARGGSDIIQILPKNLAFQQGMDSLACVRLTSKGMVRWYAACCKTPIGNTLANYKISFVGLLHNCLESPDHPLQNSFGPVRCSVNGQGAIGEPKPKTSGTGVVLWWFGKTVLKARINGDYKKTPFFRMDTGLPIVAPQVLRE